MIQRPRGLVFTGRAGKKEEQVNRTNCATGPASCSFGSGGCSNSMTSTG